MLGSILRMRRSRVHTSNEQPTPQYVHTVLVFLTDARRIAASASLRARIGAAPTNGSMALTTSTAGTNTSARRPVKWPAWPIIVFSMSALHGQTVTQWPQPTHEDSPANAPPSHSTRGTSASQSMLSVSVT